MGQRKSAISIDQCREAIRTCACFHFRKAARVVTQFYDDGLQPSGLRSTQFLLLLAAKALPRTTVVQMAQELGMDRTTLARNLEPLLRLDLLEVRVGDDLRTRHVQLTSKGEQQLQTMYPLWERAQHDFEGRLGAGQWEHLLGKLQHVAATIPAHPGSEDATSADN